MDTTPDGHAQRPERRLLPWLIAAAALLALATALSVLTLNDSIREIRRTAKANELIARLRSAHVSLALAQAAVRGYLLTGQEGALSGIAATQAAAEQHVRRARALAEGEPHQLRRLLDLDRLVEERRREVELARVAPPAERLDESTLDLLDSGDETMEAVHDVITAMLSDVERDIEDRAASGERAVFATVAGVSAAAAVMLLLLGVGFVAVRREAASQREHEASLIASRAAAEAANRELEAFSYSVSHDLRAPLRSIDGFSLALLEDHGDQMSEEAHRLLARVRAAAKRMGALIDDLLDLSRVSRSHMAREHLDLSVMASEILGEMAEGDKTRGVDVVVHPDITARGDAKLLRVLLSNLLGNAWKYSSTRASAIIEFGAEEHDGEIVYHVRDNGVGFDMKYVDKLFGVFQRLHPVTEFPGTGIGLALAQRVVHRHGGRIWAEGEVGKGATFSFTLASDGA